MKTAGHYIKYTTIIASSLSIPYFDQHHKYFKPFKIKIVKRFSLKYILLNEIQCTLEEKKVEKY